jgi:hypothetical protein
MEIKMEEEPKKKRKNPGKKGGKFEKDFAKQFSLWWSQKFKTPRDDIFYKSSGSGGRQTIRKKLGFETANSCGDISALDLIGMPLIGKLNIECKKGYDKEISVIAFLDSKQRQITIFKWWEKALKEAISNGRKTAMLVICRDNMQEVVCFDLEIGYKLTDKAEKLKGAKQIILFDSDQSLIMFRLNDFLKFIKPEVFMGVLND